MPDDLLLIVNPEAGSGRCGRMLPALKEMLDSRGRGYEVRLTKGPGDATDAALRADGRFSTVVCAGGDGTVHEAVQALAGNSARLGVLPLGTGNDFARMLGLPRGMEAQVEALLKGRARRFDLGRINDRYFANVVGIGFDGAVNHEYYRVQALKGVPAYLLAIIRALMRYSPVRVGLELRGEAGEVMESERDVFMLTVGNGTTCGGGFMLTPDADCEDGVLDINFVKPFSVPALLWHLPKVFRGTLHHTSYSTMDRFKSLKVRSETPLPIHVDGEMYISERLEHSIEVVPGALNVIGGFGEG